MLAILRPEIPARLLLVGGGEDEAELRRLACALKLEQFIEWTGELEEARPLLGRCDIVAQPSRWEGCPYSILEAMAAGRALVVSPLPALRELLSNQEAVFAHATPHDFATACAALWRDDTCRAEVARCARARIERDFRLDAMVEKRWALSGAGVMLQVLAAKFMRAIWFRTTDNSRFSQKTRRHRER